MMFSRNNQIKEKRWRLGLGLFSLVLLAASLAWAAGQVMNVQVRSSNLRSRPSFLGATVAEVDYGARVTVLKHQGPWVKVEGPEGKTGWLHESALSTKELAMVSGDVEAKTGASGEEIALAGKGFNEQVEKEYQKEHKKLDYSWVDRMEKIVITPTEAERFLQEGQIQPREGGH